MCVPGMDSNIAQHASGCYWSQPFGYETRLIANKLSRLLCCITLNKCAWSCVEHLPGVVWGQCPLCCALKGLVISEMLVVVLAQGIL